MTDEAVHKLFDTVARVRRPKGGYTRIVRTAWRKGDGAEKAFIELLGSEQVIDEKRQKRAEMRAKRAEKTASDGTRLPEAPPTPDSAVSESERKKERVA